MFGSREQVQSMETSKIKNEREQHPDDIWIEDYTRRRLATKNILISVLVNEEETKYDDKAETLEWRRN